METTLTEKEKREEAPYVLFYNMGQLLLEMNYKEKIGQTHDENSIEGLMLTKTWLVYTCDEEGNSFFDYFAGRHDYYQNSDLVFKYFGEEINYFAEILEQGQMVINGVLIEKEGDLL
ncbi:hypothetical protein OCD81_27885 [Bacillus paranthracis]|uniref:hypothetical protein n=1 Tax=Bacillus paranthracis TaxID=2026186 RepID=UPI0021D0D4C1|nr:hypothetical protein [Bacillus paranthracis]MCU4954500.1 hypothetical protein [Bacillus paranthracis]